MTLKNYLCDTNVSFGWYGNIHNDDHQCLTVHHYNIRPVQNVHSVPINFLLK